MARTKNSTDAILKELRAFGLAYPGAHTKSPWPGHLDLAVKDKTFAYLSLEGEPLGISCKLPHSSSVALMLPFTKPTEYGLGKSGWVSARFEDGETPPVDLLKAWIDESYRAQAPKKLVAGLPPPPDAAMSATVPKPTTAQRPAAAKKIATAAKPATSPKRAPPAAAKTAAAAKPATASTPKRAASSAAKPATATKTTTAAAPKRGTASPAKPAAARTGAASKKGAASGAPSAPTKRPR